MNSDRTTRSTRPIFQRVLAAWDRWMSARSRMRYLPLRLTPHLADVGTVLDCGSGNGEIAQRLMALVPKLSLVGVDVHRQPDARIPVRCFDGRRLPYPDKSFDAVTMIDVLHHSDDPGELLREALRVSRRKVIIKDHYWITSWDRMLLTVSDYLGNRAYGIALPYNFLRLEEWPVQFHDPEAQRTSRETFHNSAWDRVKQVVFVAEPQARAAAGQTDP